jgi:6-pyruvoyltetrahydropterin/6-carboxytetrahydropterin synthase
MDRMGFCLGRRRQVKAMYEIVVKQNFDAAHFLRGYKGKCEKIHGHRYEVIAHLKADKLDDTGLSYDFTEVKRHLRGIIGELDHNLLNDLPLFKENNPSAENIASTIYHELKNIIGDESIKLSAVEVWETPEQGAIYSENTV